MSAFKTIALIGRYNSPDVAAALATMGDYLRKQGRDVLVEKETAQNSRITRFPVADYDEIGARADLAVVQGGDGSMLNAARHLAAHRVPLVGVNQGRLGFMTDIASAKMLDAMAEILAGRHAIEERTMLAAEVRRDGAVTLATLALNDAVVNKGAVGRLIEFLVHIDGEFVYDLRVDGLRAFIGRSDPAAERAGICARADLPAHAVQPADHGERSRGDRHYPEALGRCAASFRRADAVRSSGGRPRRHSPRRAYRQVRPPSGLQLLRDAARKAALERGSLTRRCRAPAPRHSGFRHRRPARARVPAGFYRAHGRDRRRKIHPDRRAVARAR